MVTYLLLGDLDVLVLADTCSAELDVASLTGLEDVAGLGPDEELLLVDEDVQEVLLVVVVGVSVGGLLVVGVLLGDIEVLHGADEVVLGGRVVPGTGTGRDAGVKPGTHVASHGERLEVLVGLGVDVCLKLGLDVFGDVGHDVLEDLLLGSRPGETGLGLLLLLLLLLGSSRRLVDLGLGGLGGRRSGRGSRGSKDTVAEGDEVATSCGNVGVGGGLVRLGDTLEVVLSLAGRGKEGVLHLLRDSAGACLGVGLRIGIRVRRRGHRCRRRNGRRCRRAFNETKADEEFLRKLARIVGERVSACGEVVHCIRDLLVQDVLDRRRCGGGHSFVRYVRLRAFTWVFVKVCGDSPGF